MKQYTLLVIILAFSLTIIGQNDNPPVLTQENKTLRNEIGLNIYNVTDLNQRNVGSGVFVDYYYNVLNGIMYKRHFGKNAIRVEADYFYAKSVDFARYSGFNDDQQINFGELKIGYERKLTTTKLQPFLASDLSLTYGQIKGTRVVWGRAFAPLSSDYPYDLRIKEIGVVPTIGLKYYPIKHFSITIETSINIVYANLKDQEPRVEGPLIDYTPNTPIFYSDSEIRFYFNPLRLLSINYHF